jgi:hypothetical protein
MALLAALVVIRVILYPRTQTDEPASATALALDLSAFKHDHPSIGNLVRWDGQIVVQSDAFYTLDLERAAASVLQLPGAKEIVSLASQEPARPLALCRDADGLFLLVKREAKWQRRELPEAIRKSDRHYKVAADPTAVVLIGGGPTIVRLNAAASEPAEIPLVPKPLRPEPLAGPGGPSHCLLAAGKLYAGVDMGEWGGGLWAVDIQSGRIKRVPLRGGEDLPVTGLAIGPDGRVWALEGSAHLIFRRGAVSFLSDSGWQLFCNSTEDRIKNWNLPPADLHAFSFDKSGRLYVLSGKLGLARYEDGAWTRLTPGWPDYFGVASLLLPGDGKAVIATYDAGIMLFDLKSREIRRIALKR